MAAAVSGVLAYLGFGLLGLLGLPRGCALMALLSGAVTLALWAPGFPEALLGGLPWGIAVAGDRWGLGMWALGLVLHAAVLLHGRTRRGEFHPLLTILIGTCLGGALSRDLFNLYVLMDLSSLLATILVVWERRPQAVWAAFRYLVLTEVGLILYLMGLGLVYGRTGTLSISALARMGGGPLEPAWAVGAGLLLAGTAVKMGVFLLGLWLPAAHGQAPTEISAVLSGIVVKVGVVAMARLAEAFPVAPTLLILGAVTGLGGLLYALREQDLKIFLAHSTVAQLGYMLVGLGMGSELGVCLYLVAHGLTKGLLFLAAGEGVACTGKRTLSALAGALPLPMALGLALGTWAMVGLPPLAGYAAKGLLLRDAPLGGKVMVTALCLGTVAVFLRLLPLLRPRGRGPWGGLGILALGVVVLGVMGLLRFPVLRDPRRMLEALLLLAGGYGVLGVLRRWSPRLPALGLDRSTLSLLLSTVGLVTLLLSLVP